MVPEVVTHREEDQLVLSLQAAAQKLSVSVSFLRLEIARDRIRPVRLGRRVLIRGAEIERYITEHEKAQR